tara:strand:- start:253 stop:702 length:450 start_codon:yes stop_codon:yes gene_type:complete
MLLIYSILIYLWLCLVALKIPLKKILHPSNPSSRLFPITYYDELGTNYRYKKQIIDCNCPDNDPECNKVTKCDTWIIIYICILILTIINIISYFIFEDSSEIFIASLIAFILYCLAPINLFHSEDSNIICKRVFNDENGQNYRFIPYAY